MGISRKIVEIHGKSCLMDSVFLGRTSWIVFWSRQRNNAAANVSLRLSKADSHHKAMCSKKSIKRLRRHRGVSQHQQCRRPYAKNTQKKKIVEANVVQLSCITQAASSTVIVNNSDSNPCSSSTAAFLLASSRKPSAKWRNLSPSTKHTKPCPSWVNLSVQSHPRFWTRTSCCQGAGASGG